MQTGSDRMPPAPAKPCPLQVTPAWPTTLQAAGWCDLSDLFAVQGETALRKSGLPSWRERLRVPLPDGRGGVEHVYLKRFAGVPLGEQLKRWRTPGRAHGTAWGEWHWMQELRRAGVPAPEPIAFAEQMRGWWEQRSAVVMRAVPGESLERWCAANPRRLPPPLQARLAELVARFHGLGLAHRDLYLSHVFAADADGENPQLTLIDLQRVIRVRRRRWIVKDLAALHYSTPPGAATRADRLRWFKAYLARRSGPARTVEALDRRDRNLLRRILRRAKRIAAHDAGRRPKPKEHAQTRSRSG